MRKQKSSLQSLPRPLEKVVEVRAIYGNLTGDVLLVGSRDGLYVVRLMPDDRDDYEVGDTVRIHLEGAYYVLTKE